SAPLLPHPVVLPPHGAAPSTVVGPTAPPAPTPLGAALLPLPVTLTPSADQHHSPPSSLAPVFQRPPSSQSALLSPPPPSMLRTYQTVRKRSLPPNKLRVAPYREPARYARLSTPPPSPSHVPAPESHATPPHIPIPSDVDEIEPESSASSTSSSTASSNGSSPHPPELDQAASSHRVRTHSIHDIYHATAFSTDERITAAPPDPLEDALPLSIADALASSESTLWHGAIMEELQDLEEANTWTLVPPSQHHNIGSCKGLLKKKYHPDGTVKRYKARLVASGFSQQYDVDYFDTYSPILGMTVFRLLVAIAAKFDLLLHHLDIKTDFLHGVLCELIYMFQPPHFANPAYPNHVCQLNKPIYGLEQSARQWYTRMHEYLIGCG
ncbi:hypothetical protein GOP47_0010980, partial [Adiantum capillus-veneris]